MSDELNTISRNRLRNKKIPSISQFENLFIYFIAITLIAIDQISKLIVTKNISNLPAIIIPKFLTFTYCENRGVAFSLGSGNVTVFIVINLILITAVIFYYEKNKAKFNVFANLSYSAVIAGGIGNVIDRILRGYVVDFFDVNGYISFPIFNIADICICLGILGLAVWFAFSKKSN